VSGGRCGAYEGYRGCLGGYVGRMGAIGGVYGGYRQCLAGDVGYMGAIRGVWGDMWDIWGL